MHDKRILSNQEAIPNHAMKDWKGGWSGAQSLIWYQEPLMIAFGSPELPYLGFASGREEDESTLYSCFPMTSEGLAAFLDGRLDVASAVALAGGCVSYSLDLVSFTDVSLQLMPEDDTVVLPNTGRDYAPIMDRLPFADDRDPART